MYQPPEQHLKSWERAPGLPVGMLHLILDDDSVMPVPYWDGPDEILRVGARVVSSDGFDPWTIRVDGFVVHCTLRGHRLEHHQQPPAVLRFGAPLVIPVDDWPRVSLLGRLVAMVPGTLASRVRLHYKGQRPLLRMLEQDRRLPFDVKASKRAGLGDTRLHFDNGWELPVEAVRCWLAAELSVELAEGAGPEDQSICLPGSYFERPAAVELLELALRKLGHWRRDVGVLLWAKSLEA